MKYHLRCSTILVSIVATTNFERYKAECDITGVDHLNVLRTENVITSSLLSANYLRIRKLK